MIKVVCIVSGGIDSVCNMALWSKAEIHALTFDYGQKGHREIEAARYFANKYAKTFYVVNLKDLQALWTYTQLTNPQIPVKGTYDTSVVVPLRNAVFLTIGAGYAYNISARVVTYGSTLSDCVPHGDMHPMYPDCTPRFAKSLQEALWLGHMRSRLVEIVSPAIEGYSKVDLIRRGYEVLGDEIFKTWSCYESGNIHCGKCESCNNRKKAFTEASIIDKTPYSSSV